MSVSRESVILIHKITYQIWKYILNLDFSVITAGSNVYYMNQQVLPANPNSISNIPVFMTFARDWSTFSRAFYSEYLLLSLRLPASSNKSIVWRANIPRLPPPSCPFICHHIPFSRPFFTHFDVDEHHGGSVDATNAIMVVLVVVVVLDPVF